MYFHSFATFFYPLLVRSDLIGCSRAYARELSSAPSPSVPKMDNVNPGEVVYSGIWCNFARIFSLRTAIHLRWTRLNAFRTRILNLTYLMHCLTVVQADTPRCGSVRSRTTYQFKAYETASPAAFHDPTPMNTCKLFRTPKRRL